jgi:hypothetical protein
MKKMTTKEALRGEGFAELTVALPSLQRIVAMTEMELDFIAFRQHDSGAWILT